MFERFNDDARKAVVHAQEAARSLNSSSIGAEHLLMGVIRAESNKANEILQPLLPGPSADVYQMLHDKLGGSMSGSSVTGHIPFTDESKAVLQDALTQSLAFNHNYIGSEHLLFGLIARDNNGRRLLEGMGISSEAIRESHASSGFPDKKENDGSVAKKKDPSTATLDQFGINLTEKARNGGLDPVIGRAKEVHRMMQVLSRRSKNNPILIGEPGVGKTAVVEGLAQAIASSEVPENLQGKEIYSLDMGAMIAGARFRGDFEERLKKVLNEVKNSNNIIIFIDEIHSLVGAGAAEGAVDAASIMKPMLARGELRTIGATTLDEFRKHIEKDPALERRFQSVVIDEPSIEDTIAILTGLRSSYEEHHQVTYTDEAINAAATLSDRYISDRFLPDKAVDLLDEAGARTRLRRLTEPSAVTNLIREIAKLEVAKTDAVNANDMETAEEVKAELDTLSAELKEQRSQWKLETKDTVTEITDQDIAEVLEAWTGIPAGRLTESETARLLKMEDELHSRVIGQEDAVKAISQAIRRTRAGLKDPNRPNGSFIFAGPTGVGKTELAKALAEFMFGDEGSLITLDMSEYGEKHTVARLVGSPPGYVGHDEGGQLTEAVRRKPFSVILFDEVEKAHADVFNTLLQVLDEGRLTDSQGRVVDFKNTVIIMTSNLGTQNLSKSVRAGFQGIGTETSKYDAVKESVNEELRKHFRPEFLNRVDDTVVFHQLTQENIFSILDIMVSGLNKRLKSKDMLVVLTDNARSALSAKGYDPLLGARPLRRTLQREIEDILSEKILFGEVQSGETIKIDATGKEKDAELTFTSIRHDDISSFDFAELA